MTKIDRRSEVTVRMSTNDLMSLSMSAHGYGPGLVLSMRDDTTVRIEFEGTEVARKAEFRTFTMALLKAIAGLDLSTEWPSGYAAMSDTDLTDPEATLVALRSMLQDVPVAS